MMSLRAFTLISLTAVALLTGCAKEKPQLVLTGTRENVLEERPPLVAEPSLASLEVVLPNAVDLENWGQVGGYPDHAPLHAKLPQQVRKAWSASVGEGKSKYTRLLNTPIIADGVVFSMDSESVLYALDAKTGKRLWKKDLRQKDERDIGFSGGMAAAGGSVFAATATGHVVAFDGRSGKQLWEADVNAPVRAAPTVAEGKVFVISHDNRLTVFSAVDGSMIWTHSGIEETLGILGAGSPAVAEGIVVVPYSSGEIYALRASDGDYLWHESLGTRNGTDPFSSLGDVVGSPVIINSVVYAVNFNGRLVTFDLKTGQAYWALETSSSSTPWVAGNMVYILTDDSKLVAVYRKTGQVRWVHDLVKSAQMDKKDPVYFTGPILAGGRLIVVSSEGYAASINPKTGKAISVVKVAGGSSVAPVVAGSTLYILSDNGDVIAFR